MSDFSVGTLLLILIVKTVIHGLQASSEARRAAAKQPPITPKKGTLIDFVWACFFLAAGVALVFEQPHETRHIIAAVILLSYSAFSGIRMYLYRSSKKPPESHPM
jgi:hypothetical protein